MGTCESRAGVQGLSCLSALWPPPALSLLPVELDADGALPAGMFWGVHATVFSGSCQASYLTVCRQTPAWLEQMIAHTTWRDLFYKLAEAHPDCLMLNFTVKVGRVLESGESVQGRGWFLMSVWSVACEDRVWQRSPSVHFCMPYPEEGSTEFLPVVFNQH